MRWLVGIGLALAACESDPLYRAPEPEAPPALATGTVQPAPQRFETEPVAITPTEPSRPPAEVECEDERVEIAKPLDVVLIVDNSCSMAEEIVAVEENINQSFAEVIDASGIDYRVVMLSLHGQVTTNQNAAVRKICVSAPLSDAGCSPVPEVPAVNERFFHYSAEVGSRDAWCQVFLTLDGRIPDRHDLAPAGWRDVLRPDAIKSFIVMTDDGVNCYETETGWIEDRDSASGGDEAAQVFDASLRQRHPSLFEADGRRSYVWHSIVGMDPDADRSGIVEDVALEASAAGTGHQALSMLTGGLRFPIADPDGYDQLFTEVAESTIETVIERSCDP